MCVCKHYVDQHVQKTYVYHMSLVTVCYLKQSLHDQTSDATRLTLPDPILPEPTRSDTTWPDQGQTGAIIRDKYHQPNLGFFFQSVDI